MAQSEAQFFLTNSPCQKNSGGGAPSCRDKQRALHEQDSLTITSSKAVLERDVRLPASQLRGLSASGWASSARIALQAPWTASNEARTEKGSQSESESEDSDKRRNVWPRAGCQKQTT